VVNLVWDVLGIVLSVGLLLLINRIGGDRLREAKQKLQAHRIGWLVRAAVLGLFVWLVWRWVSS
jgi:membrane protein DedA with SNARE-associated domain